MAVILDAEHPKPTPGRRWADRYPEALQQLVDPSITVVDNDFSQRWALPAGWVLIVNRLHRDLTDVLGHYEVARAGNKMSALRYAIERHSADHPGPQVQQRVNELLQAAKDESLATCDLCGGSADGSISRGTTRCEEHPASGQGRVEGSVARPPGWRPAGR